MVVAKSCHGLSFARKFPGDIETSFLSKKEWKKSIREAIDFAMEHDI
jgi:hypothetical protein